jgi:hypothetical protein
MVPASSFTIRNTSIEVVYEPYVEILLLPAGHEIEIRTDGSINSVQLQIAQERLSHCCVCFR